MRALLMLFLLLSVPIQGCFGRLTLPSEEELRPSLVKAFTFAQHGRLLSEKDASELRQELSGEERALYERLEGNLESPCPPGDERCAREKTEELAELYRAWALAFPDAFEVQLTSAAGLFFIGQSTKRVGFAKALANELIEDGRTRLTTLVGAYPEEPMVHGQLAFMKTFEEGKNAEIKEHIAQCLRLDPTTDWCRKLARKY